MALFFTQLSVVAEIPLKLEHQQQQHQRVGAFDPLIVSLLLVLHLYFCPIFSLINSHFIAVWNYSDTSNTIICISSNNTTPQHQKQHLRECTLDQSISFLHLVPHPQFCFVLSLLTFCFIVVYISPQLFQ